MIKGYPEVQQPGQPTPACGQGLAPGWQGPGCLGPAAASEPQSCVGQPSTGPPHLSLGWRTGLLLCGNPRAPPAPSPACVIHKLVTGLSAVARPY